MLLAALLAWTAVPAAAAPGDLDRSFGSNGRLVQNLGTTAAPTRAADVALQDDGRLIVAQSPGGLVRYLPDGAIDQTFHLDPAVDLGITAVALQPDGKILGLASNDVVRLRPDGQLDPTFGANGTAGLGPLLGSSIALATDGRIVVGGELPVSCGRGPCGSYLAVARFLPSGLPDNSFDGDGVVLTPDVGGPGRSVAVQPDGRIVVVAGYGHRKVIRYTEAGALDAAFGGTGIVDPPAEMTATSLAIDSNGRILVAGDVGNGFSPPRDIALARLLPSGPADPTFGGFGIARTDAGGSDVANALAVQADGKIVVAGSSIETGACALQPIPTCREDFTLIRYSPDGSLDTAFGGDGTVAADFGSTAAFNEGGFLGLALSGHGDVVAVGNAIQGFSSDSNGVIARYGTDGALDGGFDVDGFLILSSRTSSLDAGYAVAIQPDGRFLLGGGTDAGGRYSRSAFALARYLPNGRPDHTFGGGDGLVTLGIGFPNSLQELSILPDGGIIALGRLRTATALIRFSPDGSLDGGFGDGGVSQLPLNAAALAVQADGKLVVAGQRAGDVSDQALVVERLTTEGHPDLGFGGGDGTTEVGFGAATGAGAGDVAIDRKGRIVAGGWGGTAAAVIRLRRNGSLDRSFGGDGVARTKIGSLSAVRALAVYRDGSIVAAGNTSGTALLLTRFLPNGELDRRFGRRGGVSMDALHGLSFPTDLLLERGRPVLTFTGGALRAFHIARFTRFGALDRAFGEGGRVRTAFGSAASAESDAAALTRNGRLLVAGTATRGATATDFAAARYLLSAG